jgi:hypothetical protein
MFKWASMRSNERCIQGPGLQRQLHSLPAVGLQQLLVMSSSRKQATGLALAEWRLLLRRIRKQEVGQKNTCFWFALLA